MKPFLYSIEFIPEYIFLKNQLLCNKNARMKSTLIEEFENIAKHLIHSRSNRITNEN